MGAPYRTFGFVLRDREPGKVHEDDIILFLDTLQDQKKSRWIKQAIREKMARDTKKKQPSG